MTTPKPIILPSTFLFFIFTTPGVQVNCYAHLILYLFLHKGIYAMKYPYIFSTLLITIKF